MNKKDKDKLLIILFVLAYILIVVGMCLGTAFIPWQGIVLFTLCSEYFVIQPRVCNLYYKANGVNAGLDRFIPFWNDVMVFEGIDAILALISYILVMISIGIFFIPIETVGSFLGERIMLNYGVYTIRLCAVMLIINTIIVGIGYLHMTMQVKRMHTELVGKVSKYFFTNPIMYVLMFFPLIRVVTLTCLLNVLNKLVTFNSYGSMKNENKNFIEEDL